MSAIGLPGGRAFGEVLKAQQRAKGLSLRTLALQVSMSHTWPEPPLPPWGVKSTHLHRSAGRHLPRAVMPKYLKEKTQM
jgi:hypothetical protein